MFSFRRGNSHGIVRLRPQITCHPAIFSTNLKIKEQYLRKSNNCISCKTLSKSWLTQSEGCFVESFGIVGIPTLAFNPLHSWLSIDHHSLLQVALCQLEKFAPGTESKTPQERRKWQGIETRGPALKSISKNNVKHGPPIFRAFSSFLAASP